MIWVTSAFFICSLALAGCVVLSKWAHNRRRLRLRLLNGKNHLLAEQIDERLDYLSQFDTKRLDELRPLAEAGLKQLHNFLIDRQAHLQNYEELLLLQRHKLAVQSWHTHNHEAPTSPEAMGGLNSANDKESEEHQHSTSLSEHREKIESGLLERIKQVQDDEEPRSHN